ncbi:hypothetical protein PR202_gb01099 [Eleusine coracana subsp. coracana]|uniref:Pre-rRNA-processing protein RIX1 N-terminal domain-containing protein n=1 Tax=Eleusine coracana subsp. coracana TaxID=191504 RepID=A0AAV5DVR1_ELECO|nr:hypothetical protein PR202_gb01099 [Eleusine coracana subsp. coracana]
MPGVGGFLVDLNDPWLKPRLLKALVAERLPQPGGAELPPAEVASVLDAVRTHGLLAETLSGHPPDPKLTEAWRAAVDAWVERLGALVESDSGLSNLQLITAISCTSMSDLFVRLRQCSQTYFAWKARIILIAQNIIKPTNKIALVAKVPLCHMIAAIVHEMLGKAAVHSSTSFSEGNLEGPTKMSSAESVEVPARVVMLWSPSAGLQLLMQRHNWCFVRLAKFLNLKKEASSFAGRVVEPVLQLLNENAPVAVRSNFFNERLDEAIDLLRTVIKLYPSSVNRHYSKVESCIAGVVLSTKVNEKSSEKFAKALASLPSVRVSEDSWSLMMRKILIAVNKLLDDAFIGLEDEKKGHAIMMLLVPPGTDPPPTLGHQLSHLLPHAASIIRLMTEYFKVAKLPTMRTKVYSTARLLLISLGAGTSLHLLEAVVSNSVTDLNDGSENDMTMFSTHSSKVITESASKKCLLLLVSGKLEIGTKLAEFCSHALLALDVLTHPRALSLERAAPLGAGLNYGAPEMAVFGAGLYKLSSSGDLPQAMEVEDMYDDWLASKDDEPIEASLNGGAIAINTAATGSNHDRQLTPITEDPKIGPPKITDAVTDVQTSSKSDAKMVDAPTNEAVTPNMMDNPSSSGAVSTPVYTSNSDSHNRVIASFPEQMPTYGISNLEKKSPVVDASSSKLATSNEISAAPGVASSTHEAPRGSLTTFTELFGSDSGVESDSEDPMPEIQDGDPDSD